MLRKCPAFLVEQETSIQERLIYFFWVWEGGGGGGMKGVGGEMEIFSCRDLRSLCVSIETMI